MLHLFFPRDCHFIRNISNIRSRLLLSILLPSVVIATSLTSHQTLAESNLAGEEITINTDDMLKPAPKDLASKDISNEIDNGNAATSPSHSRLTRNLDSQLYSDTNDQQEIITLGNDDLWQRIKDGYAIPDSTSPLVANHEQWYRSRPDYIKRMVERSQKYLFHIVEEVEKRGMPTELALLPMIESAYNPQAYSSGRASGIWQFVPSTGKYFGLKQNWWVDNRRNVMFATDAALNYLQKLHTMFGAWDLALAAYNAGEGTVGRAIERNRKLGLPTDFESLNLPPETKNYVPKLQAVKNLMTNPGDYGLKIQTIANTPYFAKVSAPTQIDAHLAAKLAEISDDEFLALNPSYNRPVITGSGDKHELLLPILSAQTFRNNLATYDKPLVSWKTYFAKRGERLESIASKFGMQLTQLRNVNNLSAQNKIKNSSTILVPNGNSTEFNTTKPILTKNVDAITPTELSDSFTANQNADNIDLTSTENNNALNIAEKNKAENEPARQHSVTHKVKKGENMQSIAKHYGVTVKQIMASSALKNNRVKAGQLLTIASNENEKTSKHQTKEQSSGKNSLAKSSKSTNMSGKKNSSRIKNKSSVKKDPN
ncbi:MAG: transglycosylase SLT domain-containing protein [Betaproteobacteria bacterium]